MAGNSFGKLFKITTFGESHGTMIGVIIDGCPAGLELDLDFMNFEMQRRRPGQSKISTQRNEPDLFEIVSGTIKNITTGTPITVLIQNNDQRSKDYSLYQDSYRPSHADYTYEQKYGLRDHKGGGRASARETASRVIAGAIAKQVLNKYKIDIKAYVSQVGNISCTKDYTQLNFDFIDRTIVRCPDLHMAAKMIDKIQNVKAEGDSIGGKVTCVIKNVPVGLGEPVYDKVEAELAKAMMSINASKGFEIGCGFDAVKMKGSEHNDKIKIENGKIEFETNNAGGTLGGITNGDDIYFNVAFKPTSSIKKSRKIVKKATGLTEEIVDSGRHDPCIVPRAVPVVEAMAALVFVDLLLQNLGSKIEKIIM